MSIADRFKDKIFAATFITTIAMITALFLYQKFNGVPFNIYVAIIITIIVVSSAIFVWRTRRLRLKREKRS